MEADLLNSASVVVIGGAFIVMASNLVAFLLLVAMPGAPSSFLLLVVRPGAPSSVLPSGILWPGTRKFIRNRCSGEAVNS